MRARACVGDLGGSLRYSHSLRITIRCSACVLFGAADMADSWWVYLVECRNGAIYTGITRDVAARYRKHVEGKGAKYTRMNPPVRIVGTRQFESHRAAAQAEVAIKRLSAFEKRHWAVTLGKLADSVE